ncbi:MAG: hypothetical protein ACTJHW_00225 [Paenalcaligenes sp.]
MKDPIDCAVVRLDETHERARAFVGEHAQGKLRVQMLERHDSVLAQQVDDTQLLRALAMPARRFDACLLSVGQHNLAFVRKSLFFAQQSFQTPLFCLVEDLKATAMGDLLTLGVADFLRAPMCLEELRTRIYMLKRVRQTTHALHDKATTAYYAMDLDKVGAGHSVEEDHLCATILQQSGATLEAYAAAVATRYATSRESFQEAKNIVVSRFEKAYIRAALGRSAGNIAMAARSVQKHRRAFWALMRKHDIKAEGFRNPPGPPVHTDD